MPTLFYGKPRLEAGAQSNMKEIKVQAFIQGNMVYVLYMHSLHVYNVGTLQAYLIGTCTCRCCPSALVFKLDSYRARVIFITLCNA